MHRALSLSQSAVNWLLLARFDSTIAAPLPSSLGGNVGTLTVVDASNRFSQSGGALVWSGVTAAASGIGSGSALARVAGRALLTNVTSVTSTTGSPRLGWSSSGVTDTNSDCGVDFSSATVIRVRLAGAVTVDTLTIGAPPLGLAVVLRATGAFLLLRPGLSGPYTLLWVSAAGTASEFAKAAAAAGSANGVILDDFRVVDLGGAWASDYGIAAFRSAVTAANDTASGPSDCLVEHTITAATGVTQELRVRWTDDNNCWIVRMSQTGSTIKLIEIVAGVETERASAAQTWTNGNSYRVVAICDTQSIRTYVADVSKANYASAATNQTAGGVKVDTAGTSLCIWPRTIALPSWAA